MTDKNPMKDDNPGEDFDDDLPRLTDRQYKFVEGILSGKRASEVYRDVYDCSHSKPQTVWAEASRLLKNPKVAAWLSAARQAGLGQSRYTLEQHLRRLDRLQELCIVTNNMGAAVQTEQLIGKASGHYTERVEMISPDPLDSLKEIARLAPDLAERLAAEHGIDLGGTKH